MEHHWPAQDSALQGVREAEPEERGASNLFWAMAPDAANAVNNAAKVFRFITVTAAILPSFYTMSAIPASSPLMLESGA